VSGNHPEQILHRTYNAFFPTKKTNILIIHIPSRANCPSLKIERQGQ